VRTNYLRLDSDLGGIEIDIGLSKFGACPLWTVARNAVGDLHRRNGSVF
jgi:hypothetical protein